MVKVYGLAKAWDFPDASPYTCKLVMWLRLAGLEYELVYVPWPQMIERAPRRSVPWIEDADGELIHDSQRVIDRLTVEEVRAVARQDLDALASWLDDQAFFMGARPTSIDAMLYACLLQTYATACASPVVEYARTRTNLRAYFDRLRATYWGI